MLFQIIKRRIMTSDYLLKLIIVGDSGVGKSCSVMQFIQQKIKESYEITIGVQFAAKTIFFNNTLIKLQIWDTAGQQNFRSITRSYYRNAIGAILMYDITKRQSFRNIKNWIDESRSIGNASLQMILVGNKKDLNDKRQITEEQGMQLAQRMGIEFIEISSKNYENVQKAYMKLIEHIIKKLESGQIKQGSAGIKVYKSIEAQKNHSTCC